MIDLYAVGGNGGSLAQKYWDVIPFPNFPSSVKKEIGNLYYNLDNKLNFSKLSLKELLSIDISKLGNLQIDQLNKLLQQHIVDIIYKIVMNK